MTNIIIQYVKNSSWRAYIVFNIFKFNRHIFNGIAFYFIYEGKNCCMNSSTIQLWLSFQLQPTSIKNLEHWAQG